MTTPEFIFFLVLEPETKEENVLDANGNLETKVFISEYGTYAFSREEFLMYLEHVRKILL